MKAKHWPARQALEAEFKREAHERGDYLPKETKMQKLLHAFKAFFTGKPS